MRFEFIQKKEVYSKVIINANDFVIASQRYNGHNFDGIVEDLPNGDITIIKIKDENDNFYCLGCGVILKFEEEREDNLCHQCAGSGGE